MHGRGRAWSLALACAALLLVSGCGSDDGDEQPSSGGGASTGSAEQPNIAYLVYGLVDFTQAQIDGAKKSSEGEITVFNAKYNPQTQIQQCQNAIASGRFNAIIISPVQSVAAVPCVKAAAAAKIPVVSTLAPIGEDLTNPSPQVDGVVGAVAADLEQNSRLLWELTQAACEGTDPCHVLQEIASLDDPATGLRLEYFEEQAKDGSIVLDGYYASNYDPAVTTTRLPALLRSHTDVDVFLSGSDAAAAAAVKVLKAEDRTDVKLLANGGTRLGKSLVERGEAWGMFATYPRSAGVEEGRLARMAVQGEAIEEDTVNGLQPEGKPFIITKENVAEFEPEY